MPLALSERARFIKSQGKEALFKKELLYAGPGAETPARWAKTPASVLHWFTSEGRQGKYQTGESQELTAVLGRAPAGSDRHGALLQNPTQPACAGNKGLARHLRQPGRVARWRRDSREGDARKKILACSLQQRLETASRLGGGRFTV